MAEVARLDTCITVVDANEFYNNLDSMKVCLILVFFLCFFRLQEFLEFGCDARLASAVDTNDP